MPKKTKGVKDLQSEIKSLNNEVKELQRTAKLGARDVAGVTKSLKNAKKVAKAAKSANERVTEADVNKISNALAREKQILKVVDRLGSTLKQSDVNTITKALAYGKELSKLANSISGRITAREVNALNKALVNAKEVKRISNSLGDKIKSIDIKVLSNAAKYKKDSAIKAKGEQLLDSSILAKFSGDAVSTTLTGILEKVSFIPKMGEDISKMAISGSGQYKGKSTDSRPDLENEYEKAAADKAKSLKVTTQSQQSQAGMSTISSGLTSVAILALGALILSPTFRQKIIDMALSGAGAVAKAGLNAAIDKTKKAAQSLLKSDYEKVADETRAMASTELGGMTYLAKIFKYFTPEKYPGLKNFITRPVGSTIATAAKPTLGIASKFATPLNVVGATVDAGKGYTSTDYLKYGTSKSTAGMTALLAGREDDGVFWRALSRGGLGATGGAALGGKIGTFFGPGYGTAIGAAIGGLVGGLGGAALAIAGPEKVAKKIDEAKQYTENVVTSMYEDVTSGFMGSVGDSYSRMSLSIQKWYAEQELNTIDQAEALYTWGKADSDPKVVEYKKQAEQKRKEIRNKISNLESDKAKILTDRISSVDKINEDQKRRWGMPVDEWRKESYGRSPMSQMPDTSASSGAGTSDEYIARLFGAESGGKVRAANKMSSARGLGQFTKGTWIDTVKKMGVNWSLDDRYDPQKMLAATKFLTEENRQGLRKFLGREPNFTELYSAHFLGLAGSKQFLAAAQNNPNANAAQLFPYAAQKNRPIFGYDRSVEDVYGILSRKMGEKSRIPISDFSQNTVNPESLSSPTASNVVNIINSFNQVKNDNSQIQSAPQPRLPDEAAFFDKNPRYY